MAKLRQLVTASGVAPTAERAEAVKLGLEREILATEEELLRYKSDGSLLVPAVEVPLTFTEV